MKRTLTCILIITTLLTLLFTSCNADASAGLFKQLAEAKKPVNIRYRQIIGKDATHLYFLTNDGIYKTVGNTTTTVRENKKGHPVYEAYIDKSTATHYIIYLINDGGTAKVYRFDPSGNPDPEMTFGTSLVEPKIKHLLPNGKVVVQGKKSGKNAFAIIEHNYTDDTSDISKEVLFEDLDGYGLDSILFMSGKQQDPAEFIISFVTSGGSYKHYYTEGTTAKTYELTLNKNKNLAGFWTNGTSLYLITKDGNLYGSDITDVPTGPTHMKDLSRQFPSNAFVYGMSSGGTTYLITKTTTANEALFVVSIDNTNAVDTTVVSTGYASQMSNVNIVSAFEKAAGSLLVATEKNGMFDITITDAATGEGSTAGPEDYTL